MINTKKLKGRITEKGYTIQTLSPKISLTPYTLGQKISNEAPIWLHEIENLCFELDILDEEFAEFFLQKELQKSNK